LALVTLPAEQAIIATAQYKSRRNSNFLLVTTAVKSCGFGNSANATSYDSNCNN